MWWPSAERQTAGVEPKPTLVPSPSVDPDRKQDEERSPLEQELMKRHMRLEKFEREAEEQRERSKCAPEFVRVKESLKRTAITSAVEKEL
ncbi:hypothetical protein QQF64_028343 [Cirrhinus molitorella]|uniref:Actin-associated protein FAM107A n=1 Tax=Cirrhinus molitorella TaxID=172907 RepID=A0ABR3N6R4_9TELE